MIKLIGYQKGINLGGWLSQGSLERSHIENFITEEDIKAEFKNGTLKVTVPKKEEKKELPEAKHIAIE